MKVPALSLHDALPIFTDPHVSAGGVSSTSVSVVEQLALFPLVSLTVDVESMEHRAERQSGAAVTDSAPSPSSTPLAHTTKTAEQSLKGVSLLSMADWD